MCKHRRASNVAIAEKDGSAELQLNAYEQSSSLLPADDAIGAIRQLREQSGGGVQVFGSASLATQLIANDLVDEYRLMVEPILLGGGKRIFPDDGSARPLELVSTATAKTGVLICTYRPGSGSAS